MRRHSWLSECRKMTPQQYLLLSVLVLAVLLFFTKWISLTATVILLNVLLFFSRVISMGDIFLGLTDSSVILAGAMFILGGVCFICLGLINELLPWTLPLWKQMLLGAAVITYFELITGCIVNIWLGWNIWDYSGLPGNILGQICPQFSFLWLWISLAGIVLDDWLRYWLFGEERPRYRLV